MIRLLAIAFLLTACSSTQGNSADDGFEVARAVAILEQGDDIAKQIVATLLTAIVSSDVDRDGRIRPVEYVLCGSLIVSGLLPLFLDPSPGTQTP